MDDRSGEGDALSGDSIDRQETLPGLGETPGDFGGAEAEEGEPLRLLLTGPPGCGKTTAAVRVVEGMEGAGRPIRGIVTEEIREEDRRVGFSIVGLHGGDEAVMAHVDFREGPRVSRYRVDVAAVDRIVAEELEAVPDDAVVVIDEIGKMECFSERFIEAVREVDRTEAAAIATIPARASGPARDLVESLRSDPRWELVELHRDNRDAVPGEILGRLGRGRDAR